MPGRRWVIGTIAAAIVTVAGVGLAHALTTIEAPVTSDGARYAAPDPDQGLGQGLRGQNGDSGRGFSIRIRPQPRDTDLSSPYDRQRLPWLPGQRLPSR